MTRNEFNLLYTVKKKGVLSCRMLAELTDLSVGFVSGALRKFKECDMINDSGITQAGLDALAPYKVKNAVIMAAGMSSRFVPLSLEKPKGLLVVKNEVLIERQIEQLREAGIEEIVLILGYKKESFFYLEDKYNVKIIINPEYNTKNNTHTLFLAQKYISNTYICSSDDYFEENVFEDYVYQSYYASIHVDKHTNEWYMKPDSKNNIADVKKTGNDGYIMLGHVYWNSEFSQAFLKLLNEHHELGDYDANLWEELYADNVKNLPPMQIKEYSKDVIFEFDSLEELRQFDLYYVQNTHSKIMKNICKVLGCGEEDIVGLRPIKEGMTNTSFVFEVGGKKYVYRHPGDGTEEIISREREKKSLELAKLIGVDPTYLYMDEKEGWKISVYMENIRTPDYQNFDDTKRVLSVLRQLHDRKLSVDWWFRPWEDTLKTEQLLREKGEIAVSDFEELKENVRLCYEKTKTDGVKPCFCHCDTYSPNWMLTDDETILIDWEYAGNAYPGCDVGCYIMDAMYGVDEAKKVIEEYCGDDFNDAQLFHHLAYTAIVSYYWFVWALYRESCGAVMGESLHNWYVMAKRYSSYLVSKM